MSNRADIQDLLSIGLLIIYGVVVVMGLIPDDRYKDLYSLLTMVLVYYFTKYAPKEGQS